MKKSEVGEIAKRLRLLRKEILNLTQKELAESIGVSPSLIAMQELDKQPPSRAHLQKLQERFGASINWILLGEGEPLPAGYVQPSKLRNASKNFIKSEDCDLNAAALLLISPAVPGISVPGRFGFLHLSGTKLRMHAARDEGLEGTNLFRVFEDDNIWTGLGEPNGLEMETMREYLEYGDDRSLTEWLECFRFIRWVYTCMESVESLNIVKLAKTA